MRVERVVVESGVSWKVTTFTSSEGPCIEVHGELAANPAEAGDLGSCGSGDDPFIWSLGGLSLGDTWFTVAYGQTPPGGHVELLLRNGSVLSDSEESSGLWMMIIPAAGIDPGHDVVRITAWEGLGASLGSVTPPATSALADAVAAANTLTTTDR